MVPEHVSSAQPKAQHLEVILGVSRRSVEKKLWTDIGGRGASGRCLRS